VGEGRVAADPGPPPLGLRTAKVVRTRIVEAVMIEIMIERYGNVTKAREVTSQSMIPDHSASVSQ
jgi:hypothetical protein